MNAFKRHILFILLVIILSMISVSCKQDLVQKSPMNSYEERDNRITQIPVTDIRSSEVPSKEAPEIEGPTTQVPATEVPVKEVPATEVPVVKVPIINEPTTGTSIEQSSHEIMYVEVNQYGSSLNVRDNKSTNSYIVGKLNHGEEVEVLQMEKDWARIQYMNGVGYVKKDYLTQEQPSQIANPQMGSPSQNNNESVILIEVYKEERVLKLWKEDLLIGEYRIGLGFNPTGHKDREGDGKTPEGSYYVCVKNPNSRFYLSLGVSYPGITDAKNAYDADRITQNQYDNIIAAINSGSSPPWNTPLGGEIMIHGNGSSSDWTAGCVAVDNDVMDVLWENCEVGTRIDIYP